MSTKNDNYAMGSTSQNIPVVLHDNKGVVSRRSGDRDEDELARTGKKQVLKVCSQILVCSFQSTIIDDDSATLALCLCWDSAVLC